MCIHCNHVAVLPYPALLALKGGPRTTRTHPRCLVLVFGWTELSIELTRTLSRRQAHVNPRMPSARMSLWSDRCLLKESDRGPRRDLGGGRVTHGVRERHERAAEFAPRYRLARRKERVQILEALCVATGYHRPYATPFLRGRRRLPPRQRAVRVRRCGLEGRRALKVCWEAADYLCAERLQPFLADLLLLPRWHRQLECSQ